MPVKTHLDWSEYEDAGMGDAYADIPKQGGDFAKAVAACIGSRQCETHDKKLMCPSYRVTNNPNLSTGGRVRLLKAALNGQAGADGFCEPTLVDAMDSCVACKGCKRECEANVDMALIKAEYAAHRRKIEGMRWRDWLFAHTPRWLHHARWVRFILLIVNHVVLLRWLTEKLFGISTQLALPVPAAQPFPRRPGEAAPALSSDGPETVVLFVDTFTRHFHPEVAFAAERVLKKTKANVVVAEPEDAGERALCCGRTYLAQGMLDDARHELRRTVDALYPHAVKGRRIVVLESSCGLGLRDDALALGLGAPMRVVAEQVLLLEEYLARESRAGRLVTNFEAIGQSRTMVHGHCHQKAVGAMKSMRRVLKMVPGQGFDPIEASCCGMAGTFGLEAEHHELSEKMAEAELLPALRKNPTITVVTNGFSCRQQIERHGFGSVRHLAEVLDESLSPFSPRSE